MPITGKTNHPAPWTRIVSEFFAAVWRDVTAQFPPPQSAADRRVAEKRRHKAIRRRLRGL